MRFRMSEIPPYTRARVLTDVRWCAGEGAKRRAYAALEAPIWYLRCKRIFGEGQLFMDLLRRRLLTSTHPTSLGHRSRGLGAAPRIIREQLIHRNVQRSRGWLVFKAHELCGSLISGLESNNEEEKQGPDDARREAPPAPKTLLSGTGQPSGLVPPQGLM